ncbi:MAG: hypothetical protein IJ575_09785 [Selenomonadaceae bacterium]|nr:hypothetical protein [Selenomonadaceae bacterium]
MNLVPIVILDSSNTKSVLTNFLNRGISPKNIINWYTSGKTQPIVNLENGETVFCINGIEIHCKDKSQENFAKWFDSKLKLIHDNYQIAPDQYENVIAKKVKDRLKIDMDWDNPRTIQEKIQWLNLYDATPLKTLCADKYRVREYVARKIGAKYLVPLLGFWQDPDEIDFDKLPTQFVLKTNHGSGMNIIVRDKFKLDTRFAREKLRAWLEINFGMIFLEFQYIKIPRLAIAEKFLEVLNENDIPDYKIHCFNGAPRFVQYISGRSGGMKMDYFDPTWNPVAIGRKDHPQNTDPVSKPKNLELMIELAREVSSDFPYVRADFYEIDGRVYFGELTFTPAAGMFLYDPPEWNLRVGNMLELPPKGRPFNPFEK